MFIPPKNIADQYKRPHSGTGVYLESNHLCFGKGVVDQIFQNSMNVFLAVYPEKGYLIMASTKHEFFKKLHDASQHMLKLKNSIGVRSLAIHEILIDCDLNLPEGPLRYEIKESANFLKVYLA